MSLTIQGFVDHRVGGVNGQMGLLAFPVSFFLY